jgi:hypothetical protein
MIFYQDRLGTNIGKTQKRVAFRIGSDSEEEEESD